MGGAPRNVAAAGSREGAVREATAEFLDSGAGGRIQGQMAEVAGRVSPIHGARTGSWGGFPHERRSFSCGRIAGVLFACH